MTESQTTRTTSTTSKTTAINHRPESTDQLNRRKQAPMDKGASLKSVFLCVLARKGLKHNSNQA